MKAQATIALVAGLLANAVTAQTSLGELSFGAPQCGDGKLSNINAADCNTAVAQLLGAHCSAGVCSIPAATGGASESAISVLVGNCEAFIGAFADGEAVTFNENSVQQAFPCGIQSVQDSRDSSETPSFGQGERPPFHRPPAQRQSEGSSFGVASTVNTPKQTNIWAPLDNFKASFSNQLGHRLVQLLEDGTLRLGSESVMWIDENGLPARMGLHSHGLEELERTSPHIFAGENEETTAFDNGIHTERILWRQPASEKDHSPEGESMTSSLFNLVLMEMKSMPRITHLVWKRLRQEFEISATLGRPVSERIAASRVQEAINHERKDFRSLELFRNGFTSSESLMKIHLSIPHCSMLKLAGVDPTNPDRDAALEILDDELGSSVYDVMRLAKLLQLRKVPSSWLPRGAEKLAKVVNALRAGEMGPLMRDHLETRGYSVHTNFEPPLSRGRKRRLDSE